MKKLIVLTVFLFVGGCTSGTIQADALAGVMYPVLDRHDAYVRADQTLQQVEIDSYLRSSMLIRDMVIEAQSKEE
jgi:hypothetical protein